MESSTPHNPTEEQRAVRAFKDYLGAVWNALERTGRGGEEFFRTVRKADEAYARVREFASADRPTYEYVEEFLDSGHLPDRRTLVFFLADLDYHYYLHEHLVEGKPLNTPGRRLSELTDEELEGKLEQYTISDLRTALLDRLGPAYDVAYEWPPGARSPGA